MTSFPLKIVTLDGLQFDGEAESIIVRTTEGDMGVQAGHLNCVAPLGMGRATIVTGGERRYASCIGGIIFVLGGEVKLVPTTFEWAEDIDTDRSRMVAERAKKVMADPASTPQQIHNAEAHLKRAQVRLAVAELRKRA